MQFLDRYPIVVTERFPACRQYWVRHLGFAVVFENDWFVYMQAQAGSASIGFMSPAPPPPPPRPPAPPPPVPQEQGVAPAPSAPPGPEPFEAGISMELEVADAEAALAEVRATGIEPDYPLTDEAFGQRRFSLRDPSGLWVNIVQQLG